MGYILILALLIPLLAVVLDSPPARALAKRLERTPDQPGDGSGRVEMLEAELQRLTEQVNGLEEETRFLRSLLEQRPRRSELPPGGD